MPPAVAFGRRESRAKLPDHRPVRPAPGPFSGLSGGDVAPLLAAAPTADADFAAWRRSQSLRWGLSWLASLALLAPGVICYLAHASTTVSIAVELAGVAGGFWLRAERRRRLKSISAWSPEAPED